MSRFEAHSPASDIPEKWSPETRALVPYAYASDEIDLIEVGISLWRRWRLMLAVLLGCFGLGLALVFVFARTYSYTAVIQIGSQAVPVGSGITPMQSPQSAMATLQNAYLPAAIAKYAAEHGISARKFEIDVRNPQNTQIVILSGTTVPKLGGAYIEVEAAAAKRIVADYAYVTNVIRAHLEWQLALAKIKLQQLDKKVNYQAGIAPLKQRVTAAQIQLSSLQSPATYLEQKIVLQHAIADAKSKSANLKNDLQVLTTKKKTLQAAVHLYRQQQVQLRQHLHTVRKAVLQSAQANSGPSEALTALLLSTEEQRTINQLNHVQQKLTVSLPQQMASLEQKIAQNKRQQALQKQIIEKNKQAFGSFLSKHKFAVEKQQSMLAVDQPKIGSFEAQHAADISNQKAKIKQIQSQIANIQETKLAAPPVRSAEPVGMDRKVIAILGAVVGFILALFAATIANYLAAVRRRLSESAQPAL